MPLRPAHHLEPSQQPFSTTFFVLILFVLLGGLIAVDLCLPDTAEAKVMPLVLARGASASHMHRILKDEPPPLPEPRGVVRVDPKGFIVSENPVWNKCVRGGVLPVGFIRANTDTTLHRQGRVRHLVPLSCRDYHRGHPQIWKHPDFPDLEVYLSREGKLLGLLTSGYVLGK